MEVYKLVSANKYTTESKTKWEKIELPLEEAIKQMSGDNTLSLQWKADGCIMQIILRGYDDTMLLAEKIAKQTVYEFKTQLLK